LPAESNEDARETPGARDLQEILGEPDVFRISIRGHAAIEELLSAGISEAFGWS
jgi:hypothetical protein